jgi:MFS transporter, FHS family, L-fucose permease
MSDNTALKQDSGQKRPAKRSMFTTEDGRNLAVTFTLVSSLFLLWGFCNGMIDVMDKHFQIELHLTLAQSAWVQFAHYLGYFLMAIPAGWLATKLGYKGGIIAGLLMVAVGGFWFIPATKIAAFWAFLLGVCIIAAGLTFLETIANPYTTVLGDPAYAATRINLAQSCNGIGWLLGPIAGGLFFYGKDETGRSTGAETLWIPYAGVAVVVIVLALVFYLAYVPDIKTADVYHLDESKDAKPDAGDDKRAEQSSIYSMLLGNVVVLAISLGMIAWVVFSALGTGNMTVGLVSSLPLPRDFTVNADSSLAVVVGLGVCVAIGIGAISLLRVSKTISSHNIWSHPHFSGATVAQFFYVAAQAGIFSFLINYLTSEVPAMPEAWRTGFMGGMLETHKNGILGFSDKGASFMVSVGFFCFLTGRFTGAAILRKFAAHRVLALYSVLNVLVCFLVFLKLGWFSVVCVFLSYFFMSIMFPTIFALGIHGLGARAKKASAYLVMAIMGGAILPKLMGAVGDHYNMSRAFIVPMFCFAIIAFYGYKWPDFSKAENLHVKTGAGH